MDLVGLVLRTVIQFVVVLTDRCLGMLAVVGRSGLGRLDDVVECRVVVARLGHVRSIPTSGIDNTSRAVGVRRRVCHGGQVTDNRTDDTRRQAGWLPHEQEDLERWLRGHRERAGAGPDRPLHRVVEAFGRELSDDPTLRMGVTRMIDQVPPGRAYRTRHVDNVEELLQLIDAVLTVAPEYGDSTMVMLPLAAILDWTMATPAGYAVYRDPRMNRFLHDVLGVWSDFLSGPDSLYVLNDSPSGWLSPAARRVIGIEQFRHDPDADHLGFTSWNDFFTRRLTDGARPVAAPDDDAVIVNACESTPYRIATDVRESSRFWLKDQPYSLHDLLAGDESVARLVGGTVYQAFLSATDYHRWHSPVAGTVVRAFTVGGTYYSEADAEGSDADDAPDSQAYLAHVSARAVVVIEADDPAIGLVAFVGVGMLEVSSCILDGAVVSGNHLGKGDELGYFQFGGSTHCLVFEPGAVDFFATAALPQPEQAHVVPVRSALAMARRGGATGE